MSPLTENVFVRAVEAAEFPEEPFVDLHAAAPGLQECFFKENHIPPLVGRDQFRAEQQDQCNVKDPDDEDNHRLQRTEDDMVAGVAGDVPGEELLCDFHQGGEDCASDEGALQADLSEGITL